MKTQPEWSEGLKHLITLQTLTRARAWELLGYRLSLPDYISNTTDRHGGKVKCCCMLGGYDLFTERCHHEKEQTTEHFGITALQSNFLFAGIGLTLEEREWFLDEIIAEKMKAEAVVV